MVKENLRTKTLRLPNNERIQIHSTSIKLCMRITTQNGSSIALNSKNTSCVNTNPAMLLSSLFKNTEVPRHS